MRSACLARARPAQPPPNTRPRDIDIDRIDEPPVGRVIGAGALAVVGKQRVQWVDAHRGEACPACEPGKFAQRREISDPLVAPPAERIELRRDACRLPAGAERVGQIASPGRDRQVAVHFGLVFQDDPMTPEGLRRQFCDNGLDQAAIQGCEWRKFYIARAQAE